MAKGNKNSKKGGGSAAPERASYLLKKPLAKTSKQTGGFGFHWLGGQEWVSKMISLGIKISLCSFYYVCHVMPDVSEKSKVVNVV